MLDKEILDELREHELWWEKCIIKATVELENYKKEQKKTRRLIEVFENRIENQ